MRHSTWAEDNFCQLVLSFPLWVLGIELRSKGLMQVFLPAEPPHCPMMAFTIPSRVLFLFPFRMSTFAFCSSPFSPVRAVHCGSWQHTCTGLSQHGLLPSARSHHQQITVIPAHYSPAETQVYKLQHDNSPGNFLCCWLLHTPAFPFSCKKKENPFPAPAQDINTYCTTDILSEKYFHL